MRDTAPPHWPKRTAEEAESIAGSSSRTGRVGVEKEEERERYGGWMHSAAEDVWKMIVAWVALCLENHDARQNVNKISELRWKIIPGFTFEESAKIACNNTA